MRKEKLLSVDELMDIGHEIVKSMEGRKLSVIEAQIIIFFVAQYFSWDFMRTNFVEKQRQL